MNNYKKGIRRLAFAVWFASLFILILFTVFSMRLSSFIPDEVYVVIAIFLALFPWPFYFMGYWVIRGFDDKTINIKIFYAFITIAFVVFVFIIGLLIILTKIPKEDIW